MIYPFGTDPDPMPIQEAGTLAGLLRGGALNTADDLRCALAVLCYGSNNLAPDAPAATAGKPLTEAKAASHLERLSGAQGKPVGALPWGQIIAVVEALIQAYLAAHGG